MNELEEYLIQQNQHWFGKLPNTGIIRHKYLNKIANYIDNSREILIFNGVRRSGKTVLMLQTINFLIQKYNTDPKKILYITCDSATMTNLDNPIEAILTEYKKITGNFEDFWIFFDEIQTINNFAIHIKNLYDSKKYRIIISGSTSHILKSKSSTYLSGRYLPVTVYPLSFTEYLTFGNIPIPLSKMDEIESEYHIQNQLRNYLTKGGFPAIRISENPDIQNTLLLSYYDSIVYRDIITSHTVNNPGLMQELLRYLISNTSNLHTYRKLAEIFKCEPLTIQDYISYATDGNLLYVIKRFSYSYRKQLVAPKKIYIIDTGLRPAVSFVFSKDSGRLAENAVCIELFRRGYEPMYFHETGEIDFVVLKRDSSVLLIQVCFSNTVPEREFAAFQEFTKIYPQTSTEKIILTENLETEKDGVSCIPLWKWLITEDKQNSS